MAAKCQSPIVRQKEAEAKVVKRQSPSVRQKEAEAKAAKHQASHLVYDKRRLKPKQRSARPVT